MARPEGVKLERYKNFPMREYLWNKLGNDLREPMPLMTREQAILVAHEVRHERLVITLENVETGELEVLF